MIDSPQSPAASGIPTRVIPRLAEAEGPHRVFDLDQRSSALRASSRFGAKRFRRASQSSAAFEAASKAKRAHALALWPSRRVDRELH